MGHSMGCQPSEKRNCSGAARVKSGLYKDIILEEGYLKDFLIRELTARACCRHFTFFEDVWPIAQRVTAWVAGLQKKETAQERLKQSQVCTKKLY